MGQHKALNRKEDGCFFCGRRATELHHILSGFRRANADADGLCVWLCHWCHNEPPDGVHYNPERRLYLRKIAQQEYEKTHTRAEFMARYGKNFLD